MRPTKVDNRNLMAYACRALDLPSGREAAVLVLKATWEVDDDGEARLPVSPAPVRPSAVPQDRTRSSSHRFPSDMAPIKPGTDVLLVGHARPRGQATEMEVSLRIARGDRLLVDKSARVFGTRVWQQGALGLVPGPPAPLEPTNLSWENTYGGAERRGDDVEIESRNPLGRGVALRTADLIGLPVAPIEAPRGGRSAPHGFGPIAASWSPRAERFGTVDEHWRRQRAPLPPDDFDPRHYNVAPDDQWCATPLLGDENIEVVGVRDKPWRFSLPLFAPKISLGEEERRPALDTLLIDADEGRVELVWRTAFLLPRKHQQLGTISVIQDPAPPVAHLEDLARRLREARVSA